MISIEMFVTLAIVDAILILYSYLDLNNRLYGNIIASAFAVILTVLMAIWLVNGNIVTKELLTSNNTELRVANTTGGNTTSNVTVLYNYTLSNGQIYQNGALSWFFIAIGLVQGILTIGMIKGAYEDAVETRRLEQEAEEEEWL